MRQDGLSKFLATFVVGTAAAVSFGSMQHLTWAYYFEWMSWLFPISVDAAVALGMHIWLRHSRGATAAGWLTFLGISFSLILNIWDHARMGQLPSGLLGAIPPILLGVSLLVLHLDTRPGAETWRTVKELNAALLALYDEANDTAEKTLARWNQASSRLVELAELQELAPRPIGPDVEQLSSPSTTREEPGEVEEDVEDEEVPALSYEEVLERARPIVARGGGRRQIRNQVPGASEWFSRRASKELKKELGVATPEDRESEPQPVGSGV